MGLYQYFEFLAIDRPVDDAAQKFLRGLSSRARISATSFVTHYDFGDFHGDPDDLMKRWFDVHVYFPSYGARRLILRVPDRFLKPKEVARFVERYADVEVRSAGGNTIVSMSVEELESDPGDNGRRWMAALAPLRADLIAGDRRLFYLLWLMSVDFGLTDDAELEPLPGIGPLTKPLEAFARFFEMDMCLVKAAAEAGANARRADPPTSSKAALKKMLGGLSEREKDVLLMHAVNGDRHIGADIGKRSRKKGAATPAAASLRSAGALRQRAREIAAAQERARAKRLEAGRRRDVAIAAEKQQARMKQLERLGEEAWSTIETAISRRLPASYDAAVEMLSDLRALAIQNGNSNAFDRRLIGICERHVTKAAFVKRLATAGLRCGGSPQTGRSRRS